MGANEQRRFALLSSELTILHRSVAMAGLGLTLAVATSVATLESQGQRPSSQTRDDSIIVQGRVLDSEFHRPIANAVVTLGFPVQPPAGSTDRPLRVITNTDGTFALRGVQPALYASPLVEAAGYASAYASEDSMGRPTMIAIDHQGLRNLEIVLPRAGVISGNIVDEAGEPAIDVQVRAYRRAIATGGLRLVTVGNATTDDRGAYRIGGLTPGDYIVGVTPVQLSLSVAAVNASVTTGAEGRGQSTGRPTEALRTMASGGIGSGNGIHLGNSVVLTTGPWPQPLPPPAVAGVQLSYGPTFYPGTSLPGSATAIGLRAADERSGINLQLNPKGSGTVTGRVLALDGGQTGGVGVRLVTPNANFLGEGDLVVASTVTEPDGAFCLPSVPVGNYVAEAWSVAPQPFPQAQGFTTMSVVDGFRYLTSVNGAGVETPFPVNQSLRWARIPISVQQESPAAIQLELTAGISVSGNVEFSGTRVQPDLATLLRTAISLEPSDGSRIGPNATEARGVFDAQRRFATDRVPAGRYFVRVGTPPTGWFLESVVISGHDASVNAVALSTDTLDARIVFTDQPASVTGTVVGLGSAGSGVPILFFPTTQSRWSEPGLHPRDFCLVKTGPAGAFVIADIPPGNYFAAVLDKSARLDSLTADTLLSLSHSATSVAIRPHERNVVTVQSPSPKTSWASGREIVFAKAAFEFRRPNSSLVAADVGWRRSHSTYSALAAVQRQESEITGVEISGKITDPSGKPVRRALVRLTGTGLGADRLVVSDDAGQFLFAGVPPSHVTLSASKAACLTTWFGSPTPAAGPGRVVTVKSQPINQLHLTMYPGGVVTGRTVSSTGLPQTHGVVRALAAEAVSGRTQLLLAPGHSETRVDDRGEYRLYALPPGDYIIAVTSDDSVHGGPGPTWTRGSGPKPGCGLRQHLLSFHNQY